MNGDLGAGHIEQLGAAAQALDVDLLRRWAESLARSFSGDHRILVAGNGGSAAEAQHFTAELVGRFRAERSPSSAIALHADTSTVTAIANDYGWEEVFARQVAAHGRADDILCLLSSSGKSRNLLRAAEVAAELGLKTWAFTGPRPNPLGGCCDDTLYIDADAPIVQECHLLAIHVICKYLDALPRHEASHRSDPHAAQTRGVGSGGMAAPVTGIGAPSARHAQPAAVARPDLLVIIGDSLLDRDLVGRVERLSPEAPVPVVDSLRTRLRPGGAGLAAMLGRKSGKRVTLITALSRDAASGQLRELLEAGGVHVVDIGVAAATPVKTRVRDGSRTLIMLDEATENSQIEDFLPPAGAQAIREAGAILVSDYGRGVAGVRPIRALLGAVAGQRHIVWDPHPRGYPPITGARLVTPNSREARAFLNQPPAASTDLADETANARELHGRWSAAGVAITLGQRGVLLVQGSDLPPMLVQPSARPSNPDVPPDTCGAGDQFAVSAAAMLSDHAMLSEAVTSAVDSAADYVAKGGPASIFHEPPAAFDIAASGWPQVDDLVRNVKARGGTVVAAGGCFDILHSGHVSLLAQARRLGDCLVVCLNADASVARIKGAGRPIVPEADRAEILSSLACVDAVVVFHEDTPLAALRRIQPDIFVKGGDYSAIALPETDLLRTWGGEVLTIPYLVGRSTTSLIHAATDLSTAGDS